MCVIIPKLLEIFFEGVKKIESREPAAAHQNPEGTQLEEERKSEVREAVQRFAGLY